MPFCYKHYHVSKIFFAGLKTITWVWCHIFCFSFVSWSFFFFFFAVPYTLFVVFIVPNHRGKKISFHWLTDTSKMSFNRGAFFLPPSWLKEISNPPLLCSWLTVWNWTRILKIPKIWQEYISALPHFPAPWLLGKTMWPAMAMVCKRKWFVHLPKQLSLCGTLQFSNLVKEVPFQTMQL